MNTQKSLLKLFQVLICGLFCAIVSGEDRTDATKNIEPIPENRLPEKYILNYPTMDRCCPPTRSTFFDATSDFNVIKGRRFRYQPNGGYGLPIIDKVDGKNLIHVGADLGWFQIGEPVFAIGTGVVRVSQGPSIQNNQTKKNSSKSKDGEVQPLSWGNVVMIEHRLASGEFFTSIYGHLDSNRLVAVGDLVEAGQCIGKIGRRNPLVNGGYNPHLHLGIREGRAARTGAVLFRLVVNGQPYDVKAVAITEDYIEIELPENRPQHIQIRLNNEEFTVEDRDGKPCLPARLLWRWRDPSFALTGYALSTEGWRDPIAFLRSQHADTQPAPFQLR